MVLWLIYIMKRRICWSFTNISDAAVITVLICAALLASITTVAECARPPGPSAQPEAYFNGSSYVRLSRTVSLHSLAGVSFRSCVGGELFSQRYESHTFQVTALFDQVVAAFVTPQRGRREFRVRTRALDNRWHFVGIEYDATGEHPQLALTVDSDKSVVIANWTFNTDILSSPYLEDENAVLIVGNMFSGCMREGPGLVFQPAQIFVQNVAFGPCPLTTNECKDRKDVLTVPPVDHCYHEPCMRHGTCISRLDRYECHCTARYSGNNCQIDNGPPCASKPCRNGAKCEENKVGDYTCVCAAGYHGVHCELEVSVHPLCVARPCLHNGTCNVAPQTDHYVCTCQPGYTGNNCEMDVDECADTPDACHNAGRCIDGPNNYTCDCAGTGYEGPRCETNVDECERDGLAACSGRGVCYDTYGSYVCHCDDGYDGRKCQIKLSACASLQCANGGICSESDTGATCVCPRGFTGPKCRSAATCRDLACPARSRCVDGARAQCVCDKGFYGAPGLSPNCTSLAMVCQTLPCRNGGTCTADVAHDNFNCTCAPGFYGVYCELSAMPKSMSEPSAGDVGVVASLLRCADEPCVHATMCHDYTTGYRCECESGWTGAECDVKAGASLGPGLACAARPCHNAAECSDTPEGGYHCHCLPGYTGKQCSRLAPLGGADPCPCQHGGACRPPPSSAAPPNDVVCDCLPGYEGVLCERRTDNCRDMKCNKGQVCVETVAGARCRCPDGYSGPDCGAALTGSCAAAPCGNGTCKETNATDHNFTCTCDPGYTGRYCESDVDECKIPHICNEGICVNKPGRFQCYCTPGFTGDHCEVDFDECLSHPCANNGTCQNKINNFECLCKPGFTGKDCSVNIDECVPNPCAANATCIDGVATFACVCPQGLTGKICEVNIDDCEEMPCQHGGLCTDKLNSYTCDCTGTGYSGPDCQDNIDDCAIDPCRNGATCVDAVNDYHCACYPGYTGKNCEIDIPECESSPCQYNGVCLERSNASLYRPPASATENPVLVGDEPNMNLPQSFYTEFSYEDASGLECVCVNGIVGSRCEINVNECESSPCGASGTCVDRVGRYDCECHDGFEGDHCQQEIDECDRYKPCFHGTCYDRRASYYCECEPGWGGHNCSVALVGCAGQPCLNEGACRPWLQHETTHRFNCSCHQGYHGTTCEKITTMSLSGHSYVAVNTTRDEGYDIQFRFRTTIGNGLLAIGKGLTYYILELVNGRLNLHSSLLNKWEGVFIGSHLADSKWQKVFVTINSSHLVLAANEEQTIYPINLNEGSNSSHTSFPTTFLGGTVSSLSRLTHGPSYFVGCMQDVTINGEWVLPENPEQGVTTETPVAAVVEDVTSSSPGGASWLLHSINASCSRTPQCDPNPCHSSGTCQDLWTSFRCTCQRPYLGHTCQYSLKAATFGHESTKSRSVVTVAVYDAARKAVRSVLDISMFIRTRQPTGHIFYIGSKPRPPGAGAGGYDETSVAASLVGGELVVHLRFNQTPEDYTVGGTRLDNGYDHLIQVMRNSMLVQVKLNGTEYFRKSISAARQLDAQVLYLGGPPPSPPVSPPAPSAVPSSPLTPPTAAPRALRVARSSPSRTSRSPLVPPPPSPAPAPPRAEEDISLAEDAVGAYSPADFFKGIIQDVQVSNGSYGMVVELFPLLERELELPAPLGAVSLDPRVVLEGARSDDSCAAQPCRHNGTCHITWNDYRCVCPRGYKGKSCDEMEFCQLQDCPVNSVCRNLDGGYECLANATFDGRNTTLAYKMDVGIDTLGSDDMSSPLVAPRLDSLQITYRSKTGGTLFHASHASSLLAVSVFRDQVTVEWRLGGGGNAVGDAPPSALPQLRRFKKDAPDYDWSTVHIAIADSQIKGGFAEWQKDDTPAFVAEVDGLAWLELVTRGDLYVGGAGGLDARGPADTPNVTADVLTHRSLYSMGGDTAHTAHTATTVQFDPSTESGLWEITGEDKWNYDETLGESFKGCIGQVRIGDLLLPFFTSDELYVGQTPPPLHNLAHFSLQQSRKTHQYATLGCVLCFERDCLNGGHCEDITSQYSCKCPLGFTDDNCGSNIDECQGGNAGCQNGATCVDGVGNYTCQCQTGWEGWLCDLDVDSCASSPCAHGGVCVDAAGGGGFSCACPAQWAGRTCAAPRRLTCAHTPCAPHARCKDTPSDVTGNNFTCVCSPGYEGMLCDTPFCQSRPCQHGGQCITDVPEPHCQCAAGYEGVACETEVDECERERAKGAEACMNGGKCLDRLASYACDCAHTGYTGVRCQIDVDECSEGLVDCGTGRCVNTNGSYICECASGYCGLACALPDPCSEAREAEPGVDNNGTVQLGPCMHGGHCTQRCSDKVDYTCHCVDGWGGANCTQQVVWGLEGDGSSNASTIAIAVGAALGAVLLAGAALAALAANARSKRATRGTYSPSSQEYCNPRLEMLDNALKPPPEERLI